MSDTKPMDYAKLLHSGGQTPTGETIRDEAAVLRDFEGSLSEAELWVRWKAAEERLEAMRLQYEHKRGQLKESEVRITHLYREAERNGMWAMRLFALTVASVALLASSVISTHM